MGGTLHAEKWKRKLLRIVRQAMRWGRRHLPPGLRSLVGVACIAGGTFGFLPVLGFWMIPVGMALIALDIPPLRRRLQRWLAERKPQKTPDA